MQYFQDNISIYGKLKENICAFMTSPLTLSRMGGVKRPFLSFPPCNFHKRRNQPPKLSDFSFNPFAELVFWSNPYKIEVWNYNKNRNSI